MAGTYLYGRRMYETMLPWESRAVAEGQPPCVKDDIGIGRPPRP